MVASIGLGQPLDDLADAVQGVGIGEHRSAGGNVGLHAVGQSVHASVSAKLSRHGVGELGVDDGDIRGDVEVGQRVLDALGVVGDDGEGGNLGSGTGGRGDGAEVSLLTQLGEAERLDDVIEGLLGILVEDPHGLSGIDGRAAADGDNPVRLELAHGLGALHDRLDGRIGLDALEQLDLEAAFLKVGLNVLQEPAAAHRAAARNDDGLLALEVLHLVASALTKVQIARIGKTSHTVPPKQAPLRLAYITEHPIGSVRTVLRVAGDDNARCLNVSTLRQTLFYRSGWSVIHLKPTMMKRFFYP